LAAGVLAAERDERGVDIFHSIEEGSIKATRDSLIAMRGIDRDEGDDQDVVERRIYPKTTITGSGYAHRRRADEGRDSRGGAGPWKGQLPSQIGWGVVQGGDGPSRDEEAARFLRERNTVNQPELDAH
jgi:hypothetical protein